MPSVARPGDEHGIYLALQKRVVSEFGFGGEDKGEPSAEEGVRVLRSAVSIYGDQVRDIPLYVKYNR